MGTLDREPQMFMTELSTVMKYQNKLMRRAELQEGF